jgi:hypothetical protein
MKHFRISDEIVMSISDPDDDEQLVEIEYNGNLTVGVTKTEFTDMINVFQSHKWMINDNVSLH